MARPVFLAAADRGAGSLSLIEGLVRELQILSPLKGSDVFVPHMQIGDVGIETDAAAHFSRSLEAIAASRVVVAVLDGPQVDDGVAFLVGCAFAARKPVIGYATDGRAKTHFVELALTELAHDPRSLSVALARALAE